MKLIYVLCFTEPNDFRSPIMGLPALSLTTNRKTTVMYWLVLGKLGYAIHTAVSHRTPIKEKKAWERKKKNSRHRTRKPSLTDAIPNTKAYARRRTLD